MASPFGFTKILIQILIVGMKKDNIGNNFVKEYFFRKFGIDCKKIEENKERNGKTPDFLLNKNNEIFAVCEVKNLELDPNDGTWEISGKIKEKETIQDAKITSKIESAYEQLRSFDLPKVLVFVDFWTDHVASLGHILKNEQGISTIKKEISLYVWIDKENAKREDKIYFRYFTEEGKRLRNKWKV